MYILQENEKKSEKNLSISENKMAIPFSKYGIYIKKLTRY